MDIYDIREYVLSLPFTEETTPFDETTLVYKVGGKMFAVTDMDHIWGVVVKCDPETAIALRDEHPEITGAWHFNKRHWNDIKLDGDLPRDFILEQIRNSYMLVIKHNVTPKALREEILASVAQMDGLHCDK